MTKDSILGCKPGIFNLKIKKKCTLPIVQRTELSDARVREGEDSKRYSTKAKFNLEQAMKALKGSIVTALLFL